MKTVYKITSQLLDVVRSDLRRPHRFAAERVGFLTARCSRGANGILILASKYILVPDDGYVSDPSVGAMMNETTIRSAMQIAYSEKVSITHVHMHDHYGLPSFSGIDRRESAKFVPSFVNVRPEYPHAAVVLSANSVTGLCWLPKRNKPLPIDVFVVVGPRYERILP